MALKVLRYFFRVMTGAYALNLVLYLAAYFLIGERWVVIAFFNSFAHLLILPAFILLPICLLMREWRFAAAFVPSILFFVFAWGSLLLPNEAVVAQENERPLSVLSYNMGAKGQDPQLVVDLIRDSDADIVTLQELGLAYSAAIENHLGDIYPYMALHPNQNSTQGQGFLSKFPISEDSYWQYDFLRTSLGHQRVHIEDLALTVYNLHPTHPGMNGNIFNPSYRSMEISDILQRASTETGNLILVGDFNMPDLSNDYQAIRSQYGDAFRETGQGMGWTFTIGNSPAFLRLDYLFYREGIRPLSATVLGDRAGSDHYPILVEILLERD